ncbi:GPI-anchored protein llg1 [Ancistrocladus abbreviatus]
MAVDRFLCLVLFFLLASFGSPTYISETIFESRHGSTGRTLLQTLKGCTVNFENQNYTVLTSQCKGPKYPADVCCQAFTEFACPFAENINDLTTDCATTMFSYINLYGKYPAGLFANECKGDKKGLDCTNATGAGAPGPSKSGSSHTAYVLSPMAVISSCILVLLVCLL